MAAAEAAERTGESAGENRAKENAAGEQARMEKELKNDDVYEEDGDWYMIIAIVDTDLEMNVTKMMNEALVIPVEKDAKVVPKRNRCLGCSRKCEKVPGTEILMSQAGHFHKMLKEDPPTGSKGTAGPPPVG